IVGVVARPHRPSAARKDRGRAPRHHRRTDTRCGVAVHVRLAHAGAVCDPGRSRGVGQPVASRRAGRAGDRRFGRRIDRGCRRSKAVEAAFLVLFVLLVGRLARRTGIAGSISPAETWGVALLLLALSMPYLLPWYAAWFAP